jgi:cytochrome c oxidase cbb3-type subunit 3
MTADRMRQVFTALASAAALFALSSCQRSQGGSTVEPPINAAPGMDAISAIPLGDVAGAAEYTGSVPNPYEGNAQAVQQGKDLFVKMNCAGCHGYDAKGAMGPNLTDRYWRYGGTPGSVFKSIYEGRPQGMPAWNPALPPDEIWKLVAYIESLGGTFAASDFQASVQGDRGSDNVAAEVKPTIAPSHAAPTATAAPAAKATEARPDAGGPPPPGKP